MSARRRQAGFTLVELSISLVLLLLGLLLAAQLLEETAQLFTETAGEAGDTPVPLVIARIRGDIQGSVGAYPVLAEDGTLARVVITGHPEGEIVYWKEGPTLYRIVTPDGSPPQPPAPLWRGVTDWGFNLVPGTRLVDLSVVYRRRNVPRTPLAMIPALRGRPYEELTQRLFLVPRGAGLGETW